MTIKTILFDLDGTLINTNDLILASFQHTLSSFYPGRYSEQDIVGFIGEPLEETFNKIDEARTEELITAYRKHNHAYHDELVKEYEGVYETVRSLYEQGYKLGIVTTKIRETTDKGLTLTHLAPFFETVVTYDDVENAKPDAEPLNKAMAALGGTPSSTLMIGDSQYDIMAGKNAGTRTAGVSWTIKGKSFLSSYEPDAMLDTMPDLLDMLGVKVP